MNRNIDLRILLFGFSGDHLGRVLDSFDVICSNFTASANDLSFTNEAEFISEFFDVVIFNHEAFEDTEAAVDEYILFRRKFPDISVIIVSRDVRNDDLSSERSAICDATLRYPFTPERLSGALKAATENRTARCISSLGNGGAKLGHGSGGTVLLRAE